MASPNLTTDCIAFPQFPQQDETGYDAELLVFEDDSSASFEDSSTEHRLIDLVYAGQSDAERASFKAFFDARHGKRDLFYVNIARTSETDIKVHFNQGKVKYSIDGPRTWSWTVQLVRVTS